MRTIFIFHGTAGSPEGNWFPWLKKELEEAEQQVIIPRFPTPEGQSLAAWLQILDQYKEYINGETMFIGHSLGGMFLLKVLENLQHPVCAAFFVAAPIGVRPIKYYDSDYSFTQFKFNWQKIIKKTQHFAVYHSDNDPYVSLGNGKALARHLNVPLHFISNAGHLNAESGWVKFEQLLQDIKKVL